MFQFTKIQALSEDFDTKRTKLKHFQGLIKTTDSQ